MSPLQPLSYQGLEAREGRGGGFTVLKVTLDPGGDQDWGLKDFSSSCLAPLNIVLQFSISI